VKIVARTQKQTQDGPLSQISYSNLHSWHSTEWRFEKTVLAIRPKTIGINEFETTKVQTGHISLSLRVILCIPHPGAVLSSQQRPVCAVGTRSDPVVLALALAVSPSHTQHTSAAAQVDISCLTAMLSARRRHALPVTTAHWISSPTAVQSVSLIAQPTGSQIINCSRID